MEVVIAIGMFATAAAAIPQLFTAAVRANAEAGAVTWATTLAAQKIEELRATAPLEAVVGESIDFVDQGGRRVTAPGSAPPAYTRRWWVEPLPSAPAHTLVIGVTVARFREGDDLVSHAAVAQRDLARVVTLQTETVP